MFSEEDEEWVDEEENNPDCPEGETQ